MTDDIITVSIDASGKINYRLRTSLLSTKDYGVILATLATQIASMMAIEGGFNKEKVLAQIMAAFADESDRPSAETSIHQLQ